MTRRLLLAVLPVALGAQPFEGAITMRMLGGRAGAPAQEIEYLVRSGNVRVNIASPAGAMSILGLSAESRTYMLVESQRMYMEIPAGDAAAATSAAGDVKISKTGRHETIAGLTCEHIVIETNGATGPQKTDVCMTQGLGPFVNPMGNLMTARTTDWQRQLAKDNGFPLKVTAGDGSVQLEVTKIERKRVNDALFRIPADFTRMDMPRRP